MKCYAKPGRCCKKMRKNLCPCDHSVNVCVCGIKNAVANLDALIADYERAEPAAAHYFNVYGDRVEAPTPQAPSTTSDDVRAALADARDKGLEEAAKVCDGLIAKEYATGKVDHNETAWSHCCGAAIRALRTTSEK